MPRLALPPVCRGGKNGGIPWEMRIWSGLTSASCRFMAKSPGPCATMTFCPSMCFCSGDRAVLIDWEYALILPYPTSLARLIAHGEEDENAFFHMTQLTGNLPFNPILNISSGKRE